MKPNSHRLGWAVKHKRELTEQNFKCRVVRVRFAAPVEVRE